MRDENIPLFLKTTFSFSEKADYSLYEKPIPIISLN